MFSFLFNFNNIINKNIDFNIIYLADLCNLTISLFFGIKNMFQIYNYNLLSPYKFYIGFYKSHYFNSDL